MSATASEPIRAEALTPEKKKPGKRRPTLAERQLLGQSEQGWMLCDITGQQITQTRHFADTESLLPELDAKKELILLLPMRCLLLQHLQLPSTELDEIRDMTELQVEKASMAGERGQFTCQILEQRKGSSNVLCLMQREEKIDLRYEPILAAGHFPKRVYLQAELYAKLLPSSQRTLLLYMENEDVIIALAGKERLEFAEVLDTSSETSIDGDAINQALWRAELNGLSTSFDQIALGTGCREWAQALGHYFQSPTTDLDLEWPESAELTNFTPDHWQRSEKQKLQWKIAKRWIAIGTVFYVFVIAALAAWLFFQQQQLNELEAANNKIENQLVEQAEYDARWQSWRGAVDPQASPLELLMAAYSALPSDTTQLTSFRYTPDSLLIEGEAGSLPDANLAVRNMKEEFEDRGFGVASDLPTALKNNRYHFNLRVQSYAETPPEL